MGRIESVHDYAGVLVPLEEAHLHSHSARTGRSEFESRLDDADDGVRGKDEDSERQGMLVMDAAEYTIEGLRKETREGRRGQWTEYESEFAEMVMDGAGGWHFAYPPTVKSKLINKAIQDIGMGRYNWQLFTLCGFGWFADK